MSKHYNRVSNYKTMTVFVERLGSRVLSVFQMCFSYQCNLINTLPLADCEKHKTNTEKCLLKNLKDQLTWSKAWFTFGLFSFTMFAFLTDVRNSETAIPNS